MKVYLAGPMRGYDEFNFPAFIEAAGELRERGIEVLSPAELDLDEGFDVTAPLEEHQDTKWFMKRDLPHLLDCDAVVLLPGWEESTGATIEYNVALMVGMPLYTLESIKEEVDNAPDRDTDPVLQGS